MSPERRGDPIGSAIIWAMGLALALTLLYGLVRFVKWAWVG